MITGLSLGTVFAFCAVLLFDYLADQTAYPIFKQAKRSATVLCLVGIVCFGGSILLHL